MINDKISFWKKVPWFFAFSFIMHSTIYAQVINHGVELTVLGNVDVYVHETYTDSLGGVINNDGRLYFNKSLTNRTGGLIINPDGVGKIILNGAIDQYLTGEGFIFGNLEINKPEGIFVIKNNITIKGGLTLTKGNLFLNTNQLFLGSTGKLVGEHEDSYIYGPEGFIKASDRFINHPDKNDNQAGLGIFLGSAGDFGRSTLIRRHKGLSGVSGGSIMRHFDFSPENSNSAFPTSVGMNYLPHETDIIDESSLSLWQDAGKNGQWILVNSSIDVNGNLVKAENIENLDSSLFTLATMACPEAPQIQLGDEPQILCSGDSIVLNTQLDDPKFSFRWFHNGESIEDSTSSIFITQPGTYSVQVIQDNGCNAAAQIEVIEKTSPIASFESDEVCIGSKTTFTNTSIAGEDSLMYFWDFGDQASEDDHSEASDPSYTFPSPGNYMVTLTVKSAAGCENSFQKEVNVLPLPEVKFHTDGTCQGEEIKFSADVIFPEGQKGTLYSWNIDGIPVGEGKEMSHSFGKSGAYKVSLSVATDKTCESSFKTMVTIDPVAKPSFTFIPQCEPNEILITNTTENNDDIESQTFYFHDGSSSSGTSFLKKYDSVGNYEITLLTKMKSGCEIKIVDTVNIKMRKPFLVAEATTCGNQFSFSIDPTTMPQGTSWSWNDQSTKVDYVATNSGIHWIEVQFPDGCTYRDSVNLQLNKLLNLDLAEKITACESTILEVGKYPGVSYLWSDGSTGNVLTITESGLYTVKVIDQNNCITEANSDVEILPAPIFDLGEDVSLCYGSELQLAPGIGNMAYTWTNGSTEESITVTSPGVYGLTLTNEAECSTYDEIEVSFYDPYSVSLGKDTAFCEGDKITLITEKPATTYQWGKNEEVISTNSFLEVREEGEYWVVAKDAFGCEGKAKIFVSEKEKPTAKFLASSEIEIGDTLQFIQLSYPDPIGFAWEFGDGNVSEDEDPVQVYTKEGEYSVKLKVDNGACIDEIIKKIKVVPVGESTFKFEMLPQSLIKELNIYPNPFETMVTLDIKLSMESGVYITVVNVKGEVIKEMSFTGSEKSEAIDLTQAQFGIYILSVFVGNESRVFRLLKQ
ncbi:PKD domain-containing protein [Flexithrix dorotheae]|uniref:PKD domain-containing protein n=1 Tax=Flexithrix dorotheae TaxID=70993 RepID=UPI00036A29C7|nr:PKD domain-containing protein [Flexithrix dorotheae]